MPGQADDLSADPEDILTSSRGLHKSQSEHHIRQRERRFTTVDDHTWTYVNESTAPTTEIMGYGNVPIPSYGCIAKISADSTISVRAITWNINEKPAKILTQLAEAVKDLAKNGLEDIISIALQELPSSSLNFHEEVFSILNTAFEKEHSPYISTRIWSQMLIIFIRKSHIRYATEASIKFISAAVFAKPMRTKGALGICFRFCQKWMVIVGSHLSHESYSQRTMEYQKIAKNMRFPSLHKFTHKDSLFAADIVFWTGDLNFRLQKNVHFDWKSRAMRYDNVMKAMELDELNFARKKNQAFSEFEESQIEFPPTYKFENGGKSYSPNRIPSYTDRILYRCTDGTLKKVGDYRMLETIASDHKPVSASFSLNVMGKPTTLRFLSTEWFVSFSTKNKEFRLTFFSSRYSASNK